MAMINCFIVALLANIIHVKSSNVTLGTIEGFLPGINDAFRMWKPALIEVLWSTPHISKGVYVPNSQHELYSVSSFDYDNTTAILGPNGFYGYLNVTNLVIEYDYAYTTIYGTSGICQGQVAPEVGIDWLLLKYRLRVNEPCSIQIESLVPIMGNSGILDIRTRQLSGDCSTNTLNTWGEGFVGVVNEKILEQMPLIVDSFLANQGYQWLPGWRKIVVSDPGYVLRFFPCFPSLEMTESDLTLGVSVEWNGTVTPEKKEFHLKPSKKHTAKDIIQESEIYLCVLLGIFIGFGSVIGGEKYIRRRKETKN